MQQDKTVFVDVIGQPEKPETDEADELAKQPDTKNGGESDSGKKSNQEDEKTEKIEVKVEAESKVEVEDKKKAAPTPSKAIRSCRL